MATYTIYGRCYCELNPIGETCEYLDGNSNYENWLVVTALAEQCDRDLTTVEGCKAEAIARGLTWDAEGQDFAGEWELDGCYEYNSSYTDGLYNGRAYFGTGGSDEDKLAPVKDPNIHIRIEGCGAEDQGRRLAEEVFITYEGLYTMLSENAGEIC
jgi:hypothetical protein